MHFYTLVTVDLDSAVFQVFRHIANEPDQFVEAYLPSIPHDNDFEIFNRLHDRETSNHLADDNNKPVEQFSNKNELGYFTNIQDQNKTNRDEILSSENIRNMGCLNTSLMRLFLECSLYLASMTNSQHVCAIVRDQRSGDDMSEFFYYRLGCTVKRLATYLEISQDDCFLFVHLVLNKILTFSTRRAGPTKSVELKQKEDRQRVEKDFCEFIDEKVLEDKKTVQKLVEELTDILKIEDESCPDVFFQIANELTKPSFTHQDDSILNNSLFWQFRHQITVEFFARRFNTFWKNLTPEQKSDYKLMNEFLEKLDILKVRKRIEILIITFFLIKRSVLIEFFLNKDDQTFAKNH